MTIDEWIKKYNDKDIAEMLYNLQQQKSYTDKEIIDAVDKISRVGVKVGLSLYDCVNMIVANETILKV